MATRFVAKLFSTAPFASILCGVDGDPASHEAVRQAIALAPGAGVHFVSVSATRRLPKHSRVQLRQSLGEAARLAREAGIQASTDLVSGRHAIDVLLDESEHHDLLVIGSRDRSRAVGIAIDSTASRAVHEAQCPLLIARVPPGESQFPNHILLALDGSPASWAPAQAAAEIASAFHSTLKVIRVVTGIHPERHRVVETQVAEITELTQRKPVLTEAPGHPVHVIIEASRAMGSSLVVCGHRGLHGVRAVGSVSEPVVHRAPCSALLVPAGDRRFSRQSH